MTTAGQQILITDDEPRILSTLGEILQRAGYRVHVALSGEDALEILGQESIELAIVDLQLPTMSGIELTRRVVSDWNDVPVIMLTGHGTIETAVEAMKVGATDYLIKPLDPEVLLLKIAKRLETRRFEGVSAIRGQTARPRDEIVGSSVKIFNNFSGTDTVTFLTCSFFLPCSA